MHKVIAVCTSPAKGTQKKAVPSVHLIKDWGIENDAHAGKWHRQVSLLSHDKIEAFRARGAEVADGAFGENIIVEGIDFAALPIGTRFYCNDVVLELTQIGKECHSGCEIFKKMGECIMPKQGVFTRVLHGGDIKAGDEFRVELPFRAAVITVSDSGAAGKRADLSGPVICDILAQNGYPVVHTVLLPDEREQIAAEMARLADGDMADLILTTGGTGFSPRDITPEATCAVADRNAPGIAEAMRYHSLSITPRGMLSRGVSVLRGKTLIVNLPGSPKAVQENLEYILPSLEHGVRIAAGLDGECARK